MQADPAADERHRPAAGVPHGDQAERRAAERGPHGHQRGGGQVPVGEYHPEGDQRHGLQDHGAGDVAEGKGVLTLTDPQHAVERFGKFGGQRRDHQRQHERIDAEPARQMLDAVHEQLRRPEEHADADQGLSEDLERGRRVILGGVEVQGGRLVSAALLPALDDRSPGDGRIPGHQHRRAGEA